VNNKNGKDCLWWIAFGVVVCFIVVALVLLLMRFGFI
jgi:hypothetical protein